MDLAMNTKGSNLGYVPALDGMRAFAILAVMLTHAKMRFTQGGFIGVDIFFVLSGFLITSILVREFNQHQRIDLKNFYLRRVLRLAPALLVFLATFTILSVLLLSSGKAQSNFIDSLIALFYVSNWAWAFQIHPPRFLAHTWSLSIEEQFYILWPIILISLFRFIRSRINILVVILLLTVVSCVVRVYLAFGGASMERLYNGLDTRAVAILIGCLLGFLLSSNIMNEGHHWLETSLKFLAPLSAISLLLLCAALSEKDRAVYYYWLSLVEVLSGIVILDIIYSPSSILRKILSIKILVWIGSISYGLYLWHFPIFRALRMMGFHRLEVLFIGIGCTFVVASISYYFLERPILKLKSRLAPDTPRDRPPLIVVPLSSIPAPEEGIPVGRS
jgi:peptidoglycan/LPS O-acetylase OafA/YrhL